MRKITQEAKHAFDHNYSFNKSNTKVVAYEHQTELYLFDNLIATRYLSTGTIEFCMCRYGTPTTRERLKSASVMVRQCKGVQQYLHPFTKKWVSFGCNENILLPMRKNIYRRDVKNWV